MANSNTPYRAIFISLLILGLITWHPRQISRATPPPTLCLPRWVCVDTPILNSQVIDSLDKYGDSLGQSLRILNRINLANVKKQVTLHNQVGLLKDQLTEYHTGAPIWDDSTISEVILTGDSLILIHLYQPKPKTKLFKRLKQLL